MPKIAQIQDAKGARSVKHYPELFHDFKDAEGDSLFFARQLESIEAQTYDVQYPELNGLQVFPVDSSDGEGCDTITYRTYDRAGMAKVGSSAYGGDIPMSESTGKETTVKVALITMGFYYTTEEIRRAQRAGLPLEQRRADAASWGIQTAVNKIAFGGDAETNLNGLFTHPNVPLTQVPLNGGATSRLWVNKTADEILTDLNKVVNDIWNNSKTVEKPNMLLLPPAQYQLIATKRIGAANDVSVLTYFLANNQFINSKDQIRPCFELTGAGTGGTDVVVAYTKDPRKLRLKLPMPMKWQPEQRIGLKFEVPGEATCAGLVIYYPLSVNIAYGI